MPSKLGITGFTQIPNYLWVLIIFKWLKYELMIQKVSSYATGVFYLHIWIHFNLECLILIAYTYPRIILYERKWHNVLPNNTVSVENLLIMNCMFQPLLVSELSFFWVLLCCWWWDFVLVVVILAFFFSLHALFLFFSEEKMISTAALFTIFFWECFHHKMLSNILKAL